MFMELPIGCNQGNPSKVVAIETAYLGKWNITYGKGANSHVLYYTENSIKIAPTQP